MGLIEENGLRAYFSERIDGNLSFLHGSKMEVFYNRVNVSVDNNLSLFSVRGGNEVVSHGFAPQLEHGDKILIIREENREKYNGLGIKKYGSLPCDAIITDCAGFPILIPNADCFLVALHDPIKNVLAVFHSGRLGTFINIAEKTSAKMKREFGCSPGNIKTYFFPGICEICYKQKYLESELPPAYLRKFSKKNGDETVSLNLLGIIIHQLKNAGIESMDFRHYECTAHAAFEGMAKYYSHFGHTHRFPGHEESGRNALIVEMV